MSHVPNNFGVDRHLWRQWHNTQRAIFNSVMADMSLNKDVYTHPDMPEIEDVYWNVISHNAACTAAQSLKGLSL